MNIQLNGFALLQPPLYSVEGDNVITVAISSLGIGGAERLVLEWARRISSVWRVHLVVLYNKQQEWPVPERVQVTRLHHLKRHERLEWLRAFGQTMSNRRNSVVVCHMLRAEARHALISGGAKVVTVLHNAKQGWIEDIDTLEGSQSVIAVSSACEQDLRASGWQGSVQVIKHIPSPTTPEPNARERWLQQWHVPVHATVVGMIGAMKAQKNYLFALEVLKSLHAIRDAYLVILGGPSGDEKSINSWRSVVQRINELGLRSRVAMPGFVPFATRCLPAFDCLLNTSHFEGLSIATLEARVHGKFVVASDVGGQGEMGSENLILLPKDAPARVWAHALNKALTMQPHIPHWANFPSFRLWTLAGVAREVTPSGRTLFVTANLNSGGAQRSLVNLLACAGTQHLWEVAVCGSSTEDRFYRQFLYAGVRVSRMSNNGHSFDNAEALVHKICTEGFGKVVFWNVDAKVKLLLVSALRFTKVEFVEVSPGGESFESLAKMREFEDLIAFTRGEFYERLDRLVLKYHGAYPAECIGKVAIIPNGVPKARAIKRNYALAGSPRVVVNGRIAPTKYLLEIIEAVARVQERMPDAQLHVFGGVEPSSQAYGQAVYEKARTLLGANAIFYGPQLDVPDHLAEFDICVVLGREQGCPNALLEAMSAGVPVVANDDGGTREQVINGHTGILLDERSPESIASGLLRLLADRSLAQRLAQAGKAHVDDQFSMERMVRAYKKLLV